MKAEAKYKESVSLYAETGLSIKEICERTGVGYSAFSSYLCKHFRELILKRHNLTDYTTVRLRGKKGQTTAAHYKYKDAIAACDSTEYIEYNISQIARIFGVDCTSLSNQLRRHYPDIVPRREQERRRLGIAVNLQYGARKWSRDGYAGAVEMLQNSDMTIEEAARESNVSYSGLREHILAYYPQITQQRGSRRQAAAGQKVRGQRNGNWGIHEPGEESKEKYEEAIELYRTTTLGVEEIAARLSVSLGGFRYYLRTWYPHLMVERRGYGEGVDLEQTKRYRKSTAEKYADAIERLKATDLPTAKVAAEFGLNPETFRMYLKEHCLELAAQRGMTKAAGGKLVSRRSQEKYAEAIRLYETTPDSLKSIAARLGLVYKSLGGYVRRNHPEVLERRRGKQNSSVQNGVLGKEMAAEKDLKI